MSVSAVGSVMSAQLFLAIIGIHGTVLSVASTTVSPRSAADLPYIQNVLIC